MTDAEIEAVTVGLTALVRVMREGPPWHHS
jgi:hypothetical protein